MVRSSIRLQALVAAFLLAGATGYALSGGSFRESPSGNSVVRSTTPLTNARKILMGQFSAADTWTTISEGYASRGQTADAVGVMNSAVRARPTDYQMWVGLGNALTDHARVLTPAARFAFGRAAELAPGHPAPIFFLGFAEARSGRRDLAIRRWRQILADAPADASWRPLVEDAALDLEGRMPSDHVPAR